MKAGVVWLLFVVPGVVTRGIGARHRGDEVAVATGAGDDADAHRRQHRPCDGTLPARGCWRVRLDDGESCAGDRVPQGDAVVGERSRIEDHPVDGAPRLVEPPDELSLGVRLEVDDRDFGLGGVRSQVAEMSSRVSRP